MTLVESPSSHHWIQQYHIYLDRLKIRPCGNFGRRAENYLQLVTTSSEKDRGCSFPTMAAAVRAFYVEEKGKTWIRSNGFECTVTNTSVSALRALLPVVLPQWMSRVCCQRARCGVILAQLGQRIVFLRNAVMTRWRTCSFPSTRMWRRLGKDVYDLPAGV